MMKKQQGISLLEILLSLTIIASIIILAVRYFTITDRNLRVAEAVKEIKTITRASYEWLQIQSQENFSNDPNGTTITLSALFAAHLLTPNKTDKDGTQKFIGPWGGEINIMPGTDPSFIKIVLTGLPQKDCLDLQQQLSTVAINAAASSCHSTKNNNYSGEF